MDAVHFSKKSLHWRLASAYGSLTDWEYDDHDTDICRYAKAVGFGFFRALLLTGAGGCVAFGLGDLLAWVLAMAVTGVWDLAPDWPAHITLAITIAMLATAVFLGIYVALDTHVYKVRRWWRGAKIVRQEKKQSFIAATYRKYHDKTCFRVIVDAED